MNVKVIRLLGCALVAATLAGCATTANNPRDPFEGFNRAMFSFNDALDRGLVKPVAESYRSALPPLVRAGVTNFFSNIDDLWIAVNNALQGKITDAVQDLMRFTVNTVFGLVGILDISSDMGLVKHNEDFGQTLGKWGVGSGPYLVLPLFGPSSVRDTGGLFVDGYYSPVAREDNIPLRNTAIVVRGVDRRANLLDTTNVLEEAALDKYTFVRDAFFQRRRSLIYDGNPPPDSGADLEPDEMEPKAATAPQSQHDAVQAAPVSVAGVNPQEPAAAIVGGIGGEGAVGAVSEAAPAPMIYTVFADGIALKTPKAEPDAAPVAAVVRFADDVVLQTR